MPIRVMIAENNKDTRDKLRNILALYPNCELMSSARDGQEAIQLAAQFHPDIALISLNLPGISGSKTCEILNAIYPDIMSVLLCDQQNTAIAETALYSGARAVISPNVDKKTLLDLIDNLTDLKVRRTSPEYMEWKDVTKHPRVISITGAKGGVGKTTLSVNLAVTLAKRVPGRVALIDLHSQFGDVPTMMNINPEYTMMDIQPIHSELDMDTIQAHITKHPSGVHILTTSNKPAALDALSNDCLDSILYVLKSSYRYIIMDVPAILQDITLHAMAHSNSVLLIANLFDVTTAADTMKLAEALENESIPQENIGVVLNRVSKSNQLQSKDMLKVFNGKITAYVPNDNQLVSAVNKGLPLAMSGGSSEWMQSLEQLANIAAGLPDTASPTTEKRTTSLKWWRANGTA